MYPGERFNSYSHLVGAIAGFIGLIVLVVMAVKVGDPWKIVSFSIYGATIFLLFLASTVYHGTKGSRKKLFQLFDYQAIYLLIAGSYTPFALVTLRGDLGYILLASVWSLAIFGIIWDAIFRTGKRIVPIVLYLLMGWMGAIAVGPLIDGLTLNGFLCLIAGGLFYSVGVLFYLFDHKADYFHGIWHVFVVIGCSWHYFTVYYYVL